MAGIIREEEFIVETTVPLSNSPSNRTSPTTRPNASTLPRRKKFSRAKSAPLYPANRSPYHINTIDSGEWSNRPTNYGLHGKNSSYSDLEYQLKAQLKQAAQAASEEPLTRNGVDMRRLQAFQNVFDALILKSPGYRGMFSIIKREYDDNIAKLTAEVKRLLPYRKCVEQSKQDIEEKVRKAVQEQVAAIQSDAEKMIAMRAEIEGFADVRESMERKILRLQEEIWDLNKRYCESQASKRLLLDELSAMKLEKEDNDKKFSARVAQIEEQQGKSFLTERAVEKLTRQLSDAQSKLEELQVTYKNSIPAPKYFEMVDRCKTAEKKLENVSAELEQLQTDAEVMRTTNLKARHECDILYKRVRSYTPRPDWNLLDEIPALQFVAGAESSREKIGKIVEFHKQATFRRGRAPPRPKAS